MTNQEAIERLNELDNIYNQLTYEDKEAIDKAIEALEQAPVPTCKYGVLGKIANFFQNWDGDENLKMEISVRDMREISSMHVTKCRAESKLKALEQEPYVTMKNLSDEELKHFAEEIKKARPQVIQQEPCEDAVRRQAVLNTLDYIDKTLDEDRTVKNYKELLKECYKVLPPVTPQPKTGHWIRDTITNLYHCSECRSICHQDAKSKDDYCKYCGAKMESEE